MQNNRKLKHRTSHAAFHAAKYAIVLLEFFNQQSSNYVWLLTQKAKL